MKSFILNIIFYLIGLLLFFVGGHAIVNWYLNAKPAKDAIFIWGDSQTYCGLDLDILKKQTGKQIYSAANHAAGVYDFLVFADQVPEGADVLITISKLVQVRRKENDRNTAGFSVNALWQLYQQGYDSDELFLILRKNKLPGRLYRKQTILYPPSDTITSDVAVELFESYIDTVPRFLPDKQAIYILGIKKLIKKQCSINFISFPYHSSLEAIENRSPVKPMTDKFQQTVLDLFDKSRIDTISLNQNVNQMADIFHLNQIGAQTVSKALAERIKTSSVPTLFTILWDPKDL